MQGAMFEIEKLIEVQETKKCILEHSTGKEILDIDAKYFRERFYAIKNKWEKEGLKFTIRIETHKIEYFKP